MTSLDLYAKIEDMLDFYEEYDYLHEIYLDQILAFEKKKILDVGCGSGRFLQKLQSHEFEYLGIDLSSQMIKQCQQKGLEAKCSKLDELDTRYNIITAVGDVLNYLNENTLKEFLYNISKKLTPDGIFLCDINTHYAFSEVTSGSYIKEESDRFVALESEFEEDVLHTQITLFEKQNGHYIKHRGDIIQYYYPTDHIIQLSDLTLEKTIEMSLFSEKTEKVILIFRKK